MAFASRQISHFWMNNNYATKDAYFTSVVRRCQLHWIRWLRGPIRASLIFWCRHSLQGLALAWSRYKRCHTCMNGYSPHKNIKASILKPQFMVLSSNKGALSTIRKLIYKDVSQILIKLFLRIILQNKYPDDWKEFDQNLIFGRLQTNASCRIYCTSFE